MFLFKHCYQDDHRVNVLVSTLRYKKQTMLNEQGISNEYSHQTTK